MMESESASVELVQLMEMELEAEPEKSSVPLGRRLVGAVGAWLG